MATVNSASIALSAAAKTAGITDPVAIEPPKLDLREACIVKRHFYLFERHACPIRTKLRQDRVSAGADVLGAAGDARSAIIPQLYVRLGGNAMRPTQPRPFPIRGSIRRVSSKRLGDSASTSQIFLRPLGGTLSNDATKTECLLSR